MSIFGNVEKKLEKKALDSAIDHLGREGTTGAAGIGQLNYDYESNTLSLDPDPHILEKVRESWEKYHKE